MRIIYLLLIIVLFSCGEDKHKKDIEENRYYSDYLKIYNSYDSLGVEKTLEKLDSYLAEFPNSQNAYMFKAWVYANNNELDKVDDILEKAISYNPKNAKVYYYWVSLLLKDSSKLEQSKLLNKKGLKLEEDNIELLNNKTWINIFDKQFEQAFQNSLIVLEKDTTNNFKYYRSTSIAAKSFGKDSLFEYYKALAISNGLKDTKQIESFSAGKINIHKLYKTLK